ncbi:RHS repeat-associated core domain-containing protein [Lysobacter sp. Hz 25]|uniref:RHS repeat-associated core domain-containing protein n=1 Tax=Lysobacter sp. Hz 25 TaxID=3383698 RepID=UPI0038D46257
MPLETYGYDATGNRSSLLHGGITTSYTYPGTSHRLSNVGGVSRGYDAVGNTTSIGGTAREFVYNANDRMSQVKQAGVVKASYRYNAKGERVSRADNATGAITGYTLYDEAGHWLGDYDASGAATQQAVWLGDAPVGVLAGAGTAQKLHYIQSDRLGTPRAVVDPTRNLAIWTWDAKGEAFGNSPPTQDPDQDGAAFVFNMRFPGQRYDPITGFNYNYFRDYDPVTGRYLQSDPIGLSGGMSTYLYANGRPGDLADMYGLAAGKECAKCAGSPDKPAHDSWSMERANDAWMGKISVTNEGGVTVIRGNLTVSGVGAAIAAADVNRYWNGATGNYNGTDYRSEISMTPVDRKGDWRIVPYSFKEWQRRNGELCEGEVVATARINSPKILVSPFDSWKKESVMGHEFGHSMGLDHAPKGSGSIMSYDKNPKVLPRDLYNLSIGYRK